MTGSHSGSLHLLLHNCSNSVLYMKMRAFAIRGGVNILVERTVEVKLETGLQARPAAQFVQEANRYSAHLFLEKDGKKVNAKSIMGLMSLAITNGQEIKLIADGADEEAALNHLSLFVANE